MKILTLTVYFLRCVLASVVFFYIYVIFKYKDIFSNVSLSVWPCKDIFAMFLALFTLQLLLKVRADVSTISGIICFTKILILQGSKSTKFLMLLRSWKEVEGCQCRYFEIWYSHVCYIHSSLNNWQYVSSSLISIW